MNCPVCGMEVNGTQFCPSCGANMSAFEGVSKDKVIINQTPEQQLAAGDDSVTQLIPENYMSSTGDDSVTQLIPENYMSAQGDDTATVMLDPSQVQRYMPNQQPVFNQAPSMVSTQGGYSQNINASYGGVAKKVSGVSRGFSLASLILSLALLVSCVVFVTKPLFYIVQSYCGGIYTDEEVQEAVVEQDEDDYEDTNTGVQIIVAVGILLVLIAALNAWSCLARLNNNCIKSPVNKAVGCFVFNLILTVPFIILKFMLDDVIVENSSGMFTPEEMDMFNIYDMIAVLGVVVVIISLVNIFTSASAKKSVR